ncbi:hypothetical protein QAD02_006133 [Eretmocerus hayati]|uniref:Uncharacterized protein n=1 Tax=Eretmocerus hayati TaxID=131215 RepID=A0ACC2N0U9_9HYME|nr:hypothetical protein QAD02_006133 [Eretmocerus hayati]
MWYIFTSFLITILTGKNADCADTDPFDEYRIEGDSEIIFNKQKSALSLIDEKFLSTTCIYHEVQQEIRCNISALEVGNYSAQRICNFKRDLKEYRNVKRIDGAILETYSLDNMTKSVLIWTELEGRYVYKYLSFIDLLNCPNGVLDSPQEFRHLSSSILPTHIVVHENFVEVVSFDETKCGSGRKCKITYDSMGHLQGEIEDFPAEILEGYLEPADLNIPSHGYYHNHYIFRDVKYINNSGSATQLQTYYPAGWTGGYIATSAANITFTICGKFSNNLNPLDQFFRIYCNHFKEKKSILNKNWPGISSKDVEMIAVHNLPNDGFLLSILEWAKPADNETITENVMVHFTVSKVESNGRVQNVFNPWKLIEPCFESVKPNNFISSTERDDQICFYAACVRKHVRNDGSIYQLVRYYRSCTSKNI